MKVKGAMRLSARGGKLKWNESGGAISFWCPEMGEQIAVFLKLKGCLEG